MTDSVTIHRGGTYASSYWPWGVFLGGVQAARFATLAEAKEGGRERYGIEKWTRESAGYYREAL